jgi:hypothetical protein
MDGAARRARDLYGVIGGAPEHVFVPYEGPRTDRPRAPISAHPRQENRYIEPQTAPQPATEIAGDGPVQTPLAAPRRAQCPARHPKCRIRSRAAA